MSIHISPALVYCASMSVDQSGQVTSYAVLARDTRRARYDGATAELDPPLALVDLGAFDRNAADLTRRAGDRPIRVATKSLRCRFLIERALAAPGYRGVMCYSLPEALWLHAMGTSDDLLVAYPTVDRTRVDSQEVDSQETVRAGAVIPAALAEPVEPVRAPWITLLFLANVGLWLAIYAPIQVVLPRRSSPGWCWALCTAIRRFSRSPGWRRWRPARRLPGSVRSLERP